MADVDFSSRNESYCLLKNLYHINHSIRDPWYTTFSILYALTALVSFFVNLGLIVTLYCHVKRQRRRGIVGARQYNPRKNAEATRDHLVAYLAMLDLLLSLTMPFTAIDLLTKYWPLGSDTQIIARLTRSVPTALMYFSSMILILIAIHCYRQILHPSKKQLSPSKIRILMLGFAILSIGISFPIYYNTKLVPLIPPQPGELVENIPEENNSDNSTRYVIEEMSNLIEINNKSVAEMESHALDDSKESNPFICEGPFFANLFFAKDINFCIDDWPTSNLRFVYSLFLTVAQLFIPFVVICFSYISVYFRLKHQHKIQQRVLRKETNIIRERERNKRRNKLLLAMSFSFLTARLPLGIFGILSDSNIYTFGNGMETNGILFMTCHLLGMLSACANPSIYGFRNKHVRKGMYRMFDFNQDKIWINMLQGILIFYHLL